LREVASDEVPSQLHGTVFLPEGRAAGAGVEVAARLDAIETSVLATTETDAAGDFVLPLPSPAELRGRLAARGDPSRGGEDLSLRLIATERGARLVSRPYELLVREARSGGWVPLRLEASGTLRATAVDAAGAGVADALLCVLHWPPRVDRSWEIRSAAACTYWAKSDASGTVTLRLPPGKSRLWARAPEGIFGASREGVVEAGEVLDIGTIRVGGLASIHRLSIRDEAGVPIVGAGLRLGVEHAVQRRLGSGGGGYTTHFRSDRDGRIEFSIDPGETAVEMGIGARGFVAVRALLDRSRPGLFEHEVTLLRAPSLRVRIEIEGGAPAPPDLPVRFQWPHRALGASDFRTIQLGDVGSLAQPESAVPCAEYMSLDHSDREPRRDARSGEWRIPLPGAGEYPFTASIAPGFAFRERIEVPESGEAPVWVLRLPAGRLVTLTVVNAPSPERLRLLRVWPATSSVPPADWPSTREEAVDGCLTAAPLFEDSAAGSPTRVLWIPSEFSHLFAKFLIDFEIPVSLGRDHPGHESPCALCGERGDCGHPRPSDPGAWPPGRRRFSASPPVDSASAFRLPIPEERAPTVVLDLTEPQRRVARVRVQVRVGDAPLRQRGLAVVAFRVRAGDASPVAASEPMETEASTNGEGLATLLLAPGDYEVHLPRDLAPFRPVRVTVEADREPPVLFLEFQAAEPR